MIHIDKDALECDLAETYHIYDMYELPCSRVALFSCGLREDSRIKMKINGQNISLTQTLLASITDRLSLLCWLNSDDGHYNRNRPKSILDALQGASEEEKERDYIVFDCAEDFDRELERIKREVLENE